MMTEEWSKDLGGHLERVYRFLDLSPVSNDQMKLITTKDRYNKGKGYKTTGPMLPQTRKLLYDFYKPFNEELVTLLGDVRFLRWNDYPDR